MNNQQRFEHTNCCASLSPPLNTVFHDRSGFQYSHSYGLVSAESWNTLITYIVILMLIKQWSNMWILVRIFLKYLSHHAWKYLKDMMCHLKTQFRGEFGSAGLMLGFDGLKCLFQPKCFYISMIKKVIERNCHSCEGLCRLTLYTGSPKDFFYVSFLCEPSKQTYT